MKDRIKELEHEVRDEKNVLETFNDTIKERIAENIENLQMEIEMMRQTYRSQKLDIITTKMILSGRL